MYKYISILAVAACLSTIVTAQSTFVQPNSIYIDYQGRVAVTKDSAELSWPGTSFTFRFEGTGVSGEFRDQDTANYYNVIVDDTAITKLHLDKTRKMYTLAEGLPDGKHKLEVFKRTEWDKGKTWFYGLAFDNANQLISPPSKQRKKIEFFGNSITCGYAIEDYKGDSPAGYYENNYNSYAAITARHYNAQYYCTSKSGIGVMVSWFPLIMPEMYDRLDPTTDTIKWDFKKYTPDLVVINLFQNDSWIVNQPNNAQFKARFGTTPPTEDHIVESYKNFVQTIRNTYPKAKIICMLGSMDATRAGSAWPGYIQKAVAQLNDPKIFTYFAPYKNTPGHPKTAEQKTMADGLIKFIDEKVKW